MSRARRIPRLLLPVPPPTSLEGDNAELITLWCLRILVQLGGHRNLVSRFGEPQPRILEAIGLGHAPRPAWEEALSLDGLATFLAHLARKRPRLQGPLADNLATLGEALGLSKAEREVLAFAELMDRDPGLDDTGDTLGNHLTDEHFSRALAVILDLPLGDIRRALSPQGALLSSGLCGLDHDPTRMAQKLALIPGLVHALGSPLERPEDLFGLFLRPGGECRLTLADFDHLGRDLQLLQRALSHALEHRSQGCNLLVHGPSGTGKTQLARALAKALGAVLLEVRIEGSPVDGGRRRGPPANEPLDPDDRVRTYRVAQRLLAQRPNLLVLFDEIEDVFPATLQGLLRQAPPSKAWINDLLETNPVPTLWVSNSIGQLDPALVRRFSLVVELDNPTRRVRRRLLGERLGQAGVSPAWLERMADNPNLSPALIERAANQAEILGEAPAGELEQSLERALGNTLEAMGLPRKGRGASRDPTGYRLDFLNADTDLLAITEGLRADPRGRLCLYGPPGTGKTAFAAHIARSLDRPLLARRASDLLSKWVGDTERHLSALFREAEREQAVLFLDEADSLLRERAGAQHGWEVTQVNELLTQMEDFEGLFLAATNLMDTLDEASLRRFDLKVRFDSLRPAQTEALFTQVLAEQGVATEIDGAIGDGLAQLDRLTPGDFAVVIRQLRITRAPWSAGALLEGLAAEQRAKQALSPRPMGFTAVL